MWLPRKCDYRQTPDKVIPMCRYALQVTQKPRQFHGDVIQTYPVPFRKLSSTTDVCKTLMSPFPNMKISMTFDPDLLTSLSKDIIIMYLLIKDFLPTMFEASGHLGQIILEFSVVQGIGDSICKATCPALNWGGGIIKEWIGILQLTWVPYSHWSRAVAGRPVGVSPCVVWPAPPDHSMPVPFPRVWQLCAPGHLGTDWSTSLLPLWWPQPNVMLIFRITRGATVTGCAPVISFCCKGLFISLHKYKNKHDNSKIWTS